MKRTVRLLPRASIDLDRQAEYIGRGRIEVEQKFYRAAESQFDMAGQLQESYAETPFQCVQSS